MQKEIEEYHSVLGNIKVKSQQRHGKQDDDPIKAAKVIVAVTKMEQPPLRLPLTKAAVLAMKQKINEYQTILDQWEATAISTKIEQNT